MSAPPEDRRARHRAADVEAETRVLPLFTPPADTETAVIPRFTEAQTSVIPLPAIDADATSVLTRVPDAPSWDDDKSTTPLEQPVTPPDGTEPDKGVRVVPLRPVRTEEGYRSVYSDLTRRSPASVARAVSRGVGEVLITFGLIVLLFAAYEVWGKTAIVDAHQKDLNSQLSQQWADNSTVGANPSASPGQPGDGAVIAALYVPKMKKHWVVVQGVTPTDIRYAPGHYPDTAMPGDVGNFSVAGHRTPAIFWDLDQLKVGDPVVVQTAQTWFVYRVTQSHIVSPTTVAVVAPTPNQPGIAPTTAMLTMTTCNPKFDNYQRLVVHAELSRTQPRSAGDPAELAG
jgi:sortase A